MRIEECLERIAIQEIAAVEGVLAVDDPVDASHELGFIGLHRDAIGYLSTRIRRLGQVLGHGDRRRIEPGWTDLPVWHGLTSGWIVDDPGHMIGLATGAVERAEIARERRRGGNKSG